MQCIAAQPAGRANSGAVPAWKRAYVRTVLAKSSGKAASDDIEEEPVEEAGEESDEVGEEEVRMVGMELTETGLGRAVHCADPCPHNLLS